MTPEDEVPPELRTTTAQKQEGKKPDWTESLDAEVKARVLTLMKKDERSKERIESLEELASELEEAARMKSTEVEELKNKYAQTGDLTEGHFRSNPNVSEIAIRLTQEAWDATHDLESALGLLKGNHRNWTRYILIISAGLLIAYGLYLWLG
jgi:predicted nuclease with TOPRIM domain